MKSVIQIPSTKKLPECHILVGANDVLVSYAERCLGMEAQHVQSITDAQVHPGLFRVDTDAGICITQDKVMARVALWDVSQPLEPGSLAIKEIVEEACRVVGIKPTKEIITATQWKLLEGTGEIVDIHSAIIEATQWVQLPPSPKPELPWFNPKGWFRLPQVDRELRDYLAFQGGKEGAKETRLTKLKPSEDRIQASLVAIKGWKVGWWSEETTRFLLSYIWEKGQARKSPK